MLHIQPETLSSLKRLSRDNIISIENGDVLINDEEFNLYLQRSWSMNKIKISTKIKSLGILFFVLMLSVITTNNLPK